jgi:uncharacterized protein (TIGR02466 family)
MTEEVTQPVEQITSWMYFPSLVGIIKKPEFLDMVREVSNEYLEKRKEQQTELHELYPVYMTENYFHEPKIKAFTDFIGQNCWSILDGQGYRMDNLGVSFTEMWTQEHFKHSLMDQHIHGYGSQLSGFYFLDVPEGSSRVVFHDPRPGKVQANLFEKNPTEATYASNMINFVPEEGMFIFTNSWLPHSFGRHGSDNPIRFVHFNLTVISQPQSNLAPAEVV